MSGMGRITVLGSGGWIGGALVANLLHEGREVVAVDRSSLPRWLEAKSDPGTVINTIGLTADFRQRPHETVFAHTSLVSKLLLRHGVERLLYLSSTRVYARSDSTAETTAVPCLSQDPSDLYSLSKLLGEALVLQDPRPGLKAVRLSNVVGPGQPTSTFIGALLAAIKESGAVTIQQPPTTRKDYVTLADVVRLLPAIAEQGRERLYNLGSGTNISHGEVASWLEGQGASVSFAINAEEGLTFPALCIERLQAEFEVPSSPMAKIRI